MLASRLEPISGPRSWRAAEVADDRRYVLGLDGDAAAALAELGKSDDVASKSRLRRLAATILSRLYQGPGFVVVRRFPIDDEDDSIRLFLRFGRLLGRPVVQTGAGALVERVTDLGSPTATASMTTRALVHHTDFTTLADSVEDAHFPVLGLLMVRAAKSGGESQLASGYAVHDRLLRDAPALLERLYSEFCFDRSGGPVHREKDVLLAPVFREVDGSIRVLYNRPRIQRGHGAALRRLDPLSVQALDALDDLLVSAEYNHTFGLSPGDALFVNNWSLLHNRHAFSDEAEVDRKRLLLRLWVATD